MRNLVDVITQLIEVTEYDPQHAHLTKRLKDAKQYIQDDLGTVAPEMMGSWWELVRDSLVDAIGEKEDNILWKIFTDRK